VLTVICANNKYGILQVEAARQRTGSQALTVLESPAIDWVALAGVSQWCCVYMHAGWPRTAGPHARTKTPSKNSTNKHKQAQTSTNKHKQALTHAFAHAAGLGVPGGYADTCEGLAKLLEHGLSTDGPFLVHAAL
jgi:hypothetical protein